jgi:hypothetical protein
MCLIGATSLKEKTVSVLPNGAGPDRKDGARATRIQAITWQPPSAHTSQINLIKTRCEFKGLFNCHS